MRIVVISPDSADPREVPAMEGLFAAGLERYHVRKPSWTEPELEAWLRALPVAWRARIVIHQHHALAGVLGLGGRHEKGDSQRAEDLVQETIVRAWRHPEALVDRPARPWLFAVARNLAVDAHRARQSRPNEVGQSAFDTLPAHDDADRTLESWAVAEALASLRPDHRTVIVETYYRGCSVAEAAATLGIPAGTVKSRTYYALKALKLALQERGLAP